MQRAKLRMESNPCRSLGHGRKCLRLEMDLARPNWTNAHQHAYADSHPHPDTDQDAHSYTNGHSSANKHSPINAYNDSYPY